MSGSRFGREMRAHRAAQSWSQAELGRRIAYSQPQVARVEEGSRFPTPEFARLCDTAFGAPGTFERLQEMLAEAGHADWFLPYVQEEKEARSICQYSNSIVMGMLQEEVYTRALFRAASPHAPEQLEERIAARLERRDLLARASAPYLWVIQHEAVLRIPVGGSEVMRKQIASLLTDSEMPAVTLQILPFSAGAPASSLPFIVLTRQDGSRLVYSETYSGGAIDESQTTVAEAAHTYDRLRASALSEDDSRDLMRGVLGDYR